MTQLKIRYIDGGSPEYWRQREEGFRLIHQAERAHQRVQDAPQYLFGGYDEDGDVIPVENLGPWDGCRDTSHRGKRDGGRYPHRSTSHPYRPVED